MTPNNSIEPSSDLISRLRSFKGFPLGDFIASGNNRAVYHMFNSPGRVIKIPLGEFGYKASLREAELYMESKIGFKESDIAECYLIRDNMLVMEYVKVLSDHGGRGLSGIGINSKGKEVIFDYNFI